MSMEIALDHKGQETTLHVEGMTCGSCVARVDRALRGVKGVQEAAVNLTTGMARVVGPVNRAELMRAIERAGYEGRILEGDSSKALREVRQRGQAGEDRVRRRLIYGFLFGIPAVALEMAMEHRDYLTTRFGIDFHEGYNSLIAVLSTAVMITAGWPFLTGAWRALRHRSLNMDVLVALGAGTAYAASMASFVYWMQEPHERAQVFPWTMSLPALMEFHAAVMIVLLVTLGKYLEARARHRAAAAVGGLALETGGTATRVVDSQSVETIPAEKVAVGDRIQVVAHERVPVDGEVIEGAGSADLSVVTGESVPVEAGVGAKLPGGATLADGRIILRATATASASTVARIWELVNAAQASKTEIQGLADRVAGIFVPLVILLAWVNFIVWMVATQDWHRALITTIATIVIACPCAMGLATPTAITVALGTAARHGILFTRASVLERAGKITTVVFDKTGTLTEGRPQFSTVHLLKDDRMDLKSFMQIAASAEQFSQHPLARAILEKASAMGLELFEPADFASFPGGGVRARFDDGGEFAIGSQAFVQSQGVSPDFQKPMEMMMDMGETLVMVADLKARQIIGFIGLRDMLRGDATSAIQELRRRGIQVAIVSGDSQAAVSSTLHGIDIDDVRAQVPPADKARAIADVKARRAGAVAFIGDGINDGPALAAADVGIAMAGATDLAKAAGDVLLVSNRLTSVPEVIDLSSRTLRIIKQNLFWAFAYNVAAIPLAMLAILPPGVAAGAMMLSSLTVVGNAMRLRHYPKMAVPSRTIVAPSSMAT
jgi:Cu+-exporting ATPase